MAAGTLTTPPIHHDEPTVTLAHVTSGPPPDAGVRDAGPRQGDRGPPAEARRRYRTWPWILAVVLALIVLGSVLLVMLWQGETIDANTDLIGSGGAPGTGSPNSRPARERATAPPAAGPPGAANYRGRVNRRPPAGWSPRGSPRDRPPRTDREAGPRAPRQGREPLQAPGLRLPVRGDLRRHPLRLGLRPAGRRAQGEHQEAVVAHRRPGPRRHRRPGLLGHPAAPDLGGLRSRRRLHRPADRVPELPQALPGRPPRGGVRGAEGPRRRRTAWPTSAARTAARRARGPSRATST